MSWLGNFAGAALGAVGGIFANRQQSKQFSANYDLAKDQLYRQHQIEVADLRAAGLNPILSANGGNSTFGASSGGSYENVGSAATSGYMAAQQAKNLQAQNNAIDAQIIKTRAEAQNVIADTALKQAQTANTKGLTSLIPLQRQNIYAQGTSADDDVFGYQERYAEYRYFPSMITGKLRSTDPQSLDVWHLSQKFDSLPTLSAQFIQDDPPVSRILAVQNEPQFIIDSYVEMKCARPMPVYGVPGLVDHF